MTGRQIDRRGAVVIAVLLVSSAVLPFVAVAQTSEDNVYSRTFTDYPAHLNVDQSNITGKFTVEVSTTDMPGREGDNVVLTRSRVGKGAEKWIRFNNEGAYKNVTMTVTVHGSGTPNFATSSEMGLDIVYFIGSTGGDRDMNCQTDDQIWSAANPYVNVVDCTPPVDDEIQSNLDAEQAQLDIWQSGMDSHVGAEDQHTITDNYLEDTTTVALIHGKNAYIRSLNNGSSEASALADAKAAVDEYYTVKQQNLLTTYGRQAVTMSYLDNVSENETGVSSDYVDWWTTAGTQDVTNDQDNVQYFDGSNWQHPQMYGISTTEDTVTLLNGTTATYTAPVAESHAKSASAVHPIDATDVYVFNGNNDDDDIHVYNPRIDAPNSDQNPINVTSMGTYASHWSEIQSQSQSVKGQVETLVNNTYDAYQAGDINNSDLIDPYVLSLEYSPGDEYQGWAATQLTLLGTNSPEAMDSIGEFNVSAESGDYSGILMSQSNPASGQFETNTTYDPNQIGGTQYVVTDSRIHELTTNFTISQITTSDGETRQNATIHNVTYEKSDVNVTELRLMYEDMAYWRAQVEARQQALGGGGGGGGLFGSQINQVAALIAVGALLALGLLN